MTYFLGYKGRKIINDTKTYRKMEKWTRKHKMWWIIFFLSFFPVFLIDFIAMFSGMIRYPFYKFLFFAFLGRFLRFFIVIMFLSSLVERLFILA